MFDSLINLIIVLIPISIFIGRTVVAVRKKHNKPPPKVQVRIEEEDLPHWMIREPAQATKAPVPKKHKAAGNTFKGHPKAGDLAASIESAEREAPVQAIPARKAPVKASLSPSSHEKTAAAPAGRGLFNLAHLSPMKQAVVMAEILGPPKGLQ